MVDSDLKEEFTKPFFGMLLEIPTKGRLGKLTNFRHFANPDLLLKVGQCKVKNLLNASAIGVI